jgi:hypothetical protein
VTGFGSITSGEVEGITRAVLSTEGEKASASERFGQGVKEREQARRDSLEAAEMQGRVNLLQTGANLALIPENLKIAKDRIAATKELTAAITGKPAVTADVVGSAALPAETFTSAATGDLVSTTTGEVVKSGASTAIAPDAAAAASAEAAAGGLTAATAIGTFGYGVAGGAIGRMFHDSYLADATGGAISGAIAGTYIFPGVGTIVGGVLGVAGASLDDTVICTELHRRGYVTEKERAACSLWRHRNIKDHEYIGYRLWADPVVRLMKKSSFFSYLISILGVPWIRTTANLWNPRIRVGLLQRGIGRALIAAGLPFCRFIYRRKVRYA